MPVQMGRIRPELRVVRQKDLLPMILTQQPVTLSRLDEVSFRRQNTIVVAEGPEPVIEQPVGILAKGKAVAWVVVRESEN
jgi:hypothetical protein